jgi:AbrB family looped-hinge helix DNA binding protein
MGHDNQPIKVSPSGRLSIPAKQRKALGLENGGMVVATVQDGELRIRTVKAVLDEIQEMLAPYRNVEGGGSEGLIRDRREEAAQEEREYQESLRARRS